MKLSIPKPCPANWNEMTPVGNGRFCNSCEKIVVDFTHMNEEQIKGCFLTHAGQKTCGHFRASQLASPSKNKAQLLIISLYTQSRERIKYRVPRIAALLVLGATLSLMGCNPNEEVEGKAVTGDSIAVSAIDTSELHALIQTDNLKASDSTNKK